MPKTETAALCWRAMLPSMAYQGDLERTPCVRECEVFNFAGHDETHYSRHAPLSLSQKGLYFLLSRVCLEGGHIIGQRELDTSLWRFSFC